MKKKLLFSLICLLFISIISAKAQKQECKVTWLMIKDNDERIELNSRHGMMEYNFSTGYFRFKFDISSFPGNLLAIDSGFNKLNNSEMFFEGNTDMNTFSFARAEEFRDKDLPLDGSLIINGLEKPVNTRFTPLDQVKLYKDPRLTWFFQINPKDFALPFLHKFKKIEIIVRDGYLNRL
jgi:hypothetical protein